MNRRSYLRSEYLLRRRSARGALSRARKTPISSPYNISLALSLLVRRCKLGSSRLPNSLSLPKFLQGNDNTKLILDSLKHRYYYFHLSKIFRAFPPGVPIHPWHSAHIVTPAIPRSNISSNISIRGALAVSSTMVIIQAPPGSHLNSNIHAVDAKLNSRRLQLSMTKRSRPAVITKTFSLSP